MKPDELIEKHRKYLFPSLAHSYREPLWADRGSMQYLWDIEGKRYLDFFGGILTVSVGHSNPRVTEKVIEQNQRLQHASTLLPTEAIVALAEKLAQITPGELKCSFFTNSGTEANETAVQLARVHTGAFEIIALRHGYSGRSQLAQSLTGHHTWRRSLPMGIGVVHALNPYCYRCPLGRTYPDCGIACAYDVEALIQTSTSGRIAAFLAEPIQGVGGFITPPPEYFKIVFNIVKKYGGLYIDDEVQTGFGRTGTRWFGIEHWEVTPDIMTMAKGIANGLPMGATVARKDIADSFQGLQISTFGGNPVSCVAARATIQVIEEDRLMDNAEKVGGYFRRCLLELQEKYPLIGEVRGMGLMQGVELVKDRKTKEPAAAEMVQLMEETRQRGLLIGKGGLYGNVIRLSPPLNIAKADVDDAIDILDQAFAAVEPRLAAGV
jgi:4-aminobutyrate aminotransferase-like enzyme